MTTTNHVCHFILLVAVCAVPSSAAWAAGRKQPPAERLLAGYTTEKHDAVLVRDKRSGYYLLRQGECDGGHLRLALYRDKSFLKDWVPGPKVGSARLPNLQTGRGVRIGDNYDRVRHIMGKPTWKGGSIYSRDERVYSYHHLIGTRTHGVEYITVFRVRNGRVTGIELDREELPG